MLLLTALTFSLKFSTDTSEIILLDLMCLIQQLPLLPHVIQSYNTDHNRINNNDNIRKKHHKCILCTCHLESFVFAQEETLRGLKGLQAVTLWPSAVYLTDAMKIKKYLIGILLNMTPPLFLLFLCAVCWSKNISVALKLMFCLLFFSWLISDISHIQILNSYPI